MPVGDTGSRLERAPPGRESSSKPPSARMNGDDARERARRAAAHAADGTLKGLKLPHGQSKVQRKIEIHFGQEPAGDWWPARPRLGCATGGTTGTSKSVLADARADGAESRPLVTVFLPQRA